jgi:DNA-binding protein, Tfx family
MTDNEKLDTKVETTSDNSVDSHSDKKEKEKENDTEDLDVDAILREIGFDPDINVLTRRQAEVLILRERGYRQSRIATALGTSRANVSSVESSARENVKKARETVGFAKALTAPVQVSIEAGTDLYDVPKKVYDACDTEGVKVTRTAPELMKAVADAAGDAVRGREVKQWLLVGVTNDGTIQVRRSGNKKNNDIKTNPNRNPDTTRF